MRNAVLKRKYIVTNASESVSAEQDQPSKILVLEIILADIEMHYKKLNVFKIFLKAPQIENMKLVHHLRTLEEKTDGFYLLKDFGEEKENIKVGDWYMVKYENTLYPGVVMLVYDNEFKVKVMTAVGAYWKWPENVDEIFYKKENMLEKLEPTTCTF